MNTQKVTIEQTDLQKLLACASGDAALLYLYIHSGNDPQTAMDALHMTDVRLNCAAASLRQLGLWPEERRTFLPGGERPNYSEQDVLSAMDSDGNFRMLYGEIQRLMGRSLNTEELKILLGFDRYLGMPVEVVSILVSYCKDRARKKGNLRSPSLRTIEKEAYAWAERGIDTLEEAAVFIHNQNVRGSQLSHLMGLLQIRGRELTQAESRLANQWLQMELSDELITMAYERTCLNTGGLNWAYMNKILTRWHEAGWKTAEQVNNGDRKPAERNAQRQLDEDEKAAIQRMLQGV